MAGEFIFSAGSLRYPPSFTETFPFTFHSDFVLTRDAEFRDRLFEGHLTGSGRATFFTSGGGGLGGVRRTACPNDRGCDGARVARGSSR